MNFRSFVNQKLEAKFLLLILIPVAFIITSCSTANNSAATVENLKGICDTTKGYLDEDSMYFPAEDFSSSWKFDLQLLKQSIAVGDNIKNAYSAASKIDVDPSKDPKGHLELKVENQLREFVSIYCNKNPNQASSNASDKIDHTFPLTIDKMPTDLESNGTFCQSILGKGWYCTVEIRVVNNSTTAWNGIMNANLVTSSGVVSEGSISTEVDYLTSTFDSKVNPGQGYRWSTYFEVGPDLRFSSVRIISQDKIVSIIPVCLGSNDSDSMGC